MTRDADRPFLGVMLMLGFCALAPLGDALAKVLGASVPLGQLIVIRFGVQTAVLAPLMWATGRSVKLTPRVLRLTLLRTVLHVAGVGAFFFALRFLPLADAIAIAFVAPLIMLLLSRVVLDEAVGPRRMIGCAVGFAGTMLVIQPSFVSVGAAALLPLGAAVTFALFMLVTRQIARDADPVALQAVSGAMALGLLAPPMLLGGVIGWGELGWVAPGGADWALLLLLGGVGTGAHLLMTWSLRFAPTSTLAPMQYLEIPFATAIGFAVFAEFPDGPAAIGIAVTVGSGLYVIHRERLAAIAVALPLPPET